MKRMHIHIGVEDLSNAINFYSALFGTAPEKVKADYAKWMLEDPRINFAVSTRVGAAGIDHLGFQVDEASELDEIRARLKQADLETFDEGETVCCYANSEKSWVKDPAGVPWEAFQTMADAEIFSDAGGASSDTSEEPASSCCAPTSTSCC